MKAAQKSAQVFIKDIAQHKIVGVFESALLEQPASILFAFCAFDVSDELKEIFLRPVRARAIGILDGLEPRKRDFLPSQSFRNKDLPAPIQRDFQDLFAELRWKRGQKLAFACGLNFPRCS